MGSSIQRQRYGSKKDLYSQNGATPMSGSLKTF